MDIGHHLHFKWTICLLFPVPVEIHIMRLLIAASFMMDLQCDEGINTAFVFLFILFLKYIAH